MVQLKLTPVQSDGTELSTLKVKSYVRENISVGNDFFDVDNIKQQYPHMEPIVLKRNSYANVEIIVG